MKSFDEILVPNIYHTDDFDKIRKLRLLNILVLFDLLVSIIYVFIGFFSGHLMYMKLNIVAAVFFLIIYFFLYLGRMNAAVILMIVAGSGIAILYIYYFADIGIEYYLISGVIVLSFIFGDKPIILACIFFILGFMLVLIQFLDHHFAGTISNSNHEVSGWVKYPNIIFSVILIYISMRQYHIDLHKSFSTINDQNAHLAEKNELIMQQKSMVEHSDLAKNKILSIIAHDLRGPINNLKGTLYLLLRKGLDESEKERLLKTLHESTAQTANFLELLLIWGKNQFKGERMDIARFDLSALIFEVIDMTSAQAGAKSITLSCLYTDAVFVETDRDLVHISVRNLVNNAIKFTPEAGKITVDIYSGETTVEISISDTGIGMDKVNVSAVFSMEMASRMGTMNEKGTGLGLLLVKECIERCNGSISVKSEPGTGTTFTIALPLS